MPELDSRQSLKADRMLLNELNHRINNELASVVSAVSLAAARSDNDEVKLALNEIANLLHHYADVHHALQMPENDALIDAAVYLSQLCLSIRRSKLDHRQIKLAFSARALSLQSDRCWRLGMILYELITNAARHAFAGMNGEIRIELSHSGALIKCKVEDNGSGQANEQPGRGLKIVDELAKGLDGRFEQKFGPQGSTSILVFPRSASRSDYFRS